MTLMELTVVLAVLSGIVLLVMPNISMIEDFRLRSEARRITGIIRHASESATSRREYYRVRFLPEEESLKVESSPDGFEFKGEKGSVSGGFALDEGTDLKDVVVAGIGKVDRGTVDVIFNPGIGAEPFSVHIAKGGRDLTVRYNPYSGRVRILEGYV